MAFGSSLQKRTPTLAAGKMRHRMDLVNVSKVQDSAGGTSLAANVVYAKVWASLEDTLGDTRAAGSSFTSVVTHQIVIRYIGAAPAWQPGFAYKNGALIKDPNGFLQQAQSDGTSAVSVPVWNANINQITTDATPLAWKNVGKAPARSAVNSGMQVWFQGRTFHIEAVLNPDGRNKALVLMCTELNDSNQIITSQPSGLE